MKDNNNKNFSIRRNITQFGRNVSLFVALTHTCPLLTLPGSESSYGMCLHHFKFVWLKHKGSVDLEWLLCSLDMSASIKTWVMLHTNLQSTHGPIQTWFIIRNDVFILFFFSNVLTRQQIQGKTKEHLKLEELTVSSWDHS